MFAVADEWLLWSRVVYTDIKCVLSDSKAYDKEDQSVAPLYR